MALVGTLSTMPLADLMQWLGSGTQTGTLKVERNKICKTILFREGRVVNCLSNDPREYLGQFLVSRKRISEDTLRRALAVKEESHQQLGQVLVGLGAIDPDELTRNLTAKAEETIFNLFEWEEAVFRFHNEEIDETSIAFPIDLRVEDVLLRGMQRLDEMTRIRTVFDDPGIVLRRTDRKLPDEVLRNRIARDIYDSVNGERTVAEILLHAHGSEFLVTRFLFELFRGGIVEIREIRSLRIEAPEIPEPTVEFEEARPAPAPPPAVLPANEPAVSRPVETPAVEASRATAVAQAPPEVETIEPDPPATSIREDLNVVGRLMSRGDYEAALQILDANYQENPEDDALGRMLAEAEAAFLEKTYRYHLPPQKIPVLARSIEELEGERLSPEEFFLLSRIDGSWDIKSIIQISPIREIKVLRTLKRMREKGFIEIRDVE